MGNDHRFHDHRFNERKFAMSLQATVTILPPAQSSAPVTLPAPWGEEQPRLDRHIEVWLSETARLLGATPLPTDESKRSDLLRLALALAEAERIIKTQRAEIEKLEALSLNDELTGLFNWRGFNRQVATGLAEAQRTGIGGVLIYVDIDDFKKINDTYGHAAGNQVLREIARLLSHRVRQHDSVGRLGGDEFATLLTRTSAAHGFRRVRDIAQVLEQVSILHDGTAIAVRASVGAVAFSPDDSPEALLARADRRMYDSKRGRMQLEVA